MEKGKHFSQKMDYRFLVEITKIENATFASVRKASVKANRMGSTSAYHKERSFASKCFTFWKILFHAYSLV